MCVDIRRPVTVFNAYLLMAIVARRFAAALSLDQKGGIIWVPASHPSIDVVLGSVSSGKRLHVCTKEYGKI